MFDFAPRIMTRTSPGGLARRCGASRQAVVRATGTLLDWRCSPDSQNDERSTIGVLEWAGECPRNGFSGVVSVVEVQCVIGVHRPLLLASSQLVKGLHDLPHLMQFFRWFLELYAGSGLRR